MNDELFATICFLVLMQNNGGLAEKSPDYVQEKMAMLIEGPNAFTYLDGFNQAKVLQWCTSWRMELPEKVRQYLTEIP